MQPTEKNQDEQLRGYDFYMAVNTSNPEDDDNVQVLNLASMYGLWKSPLPPGCTHCLRQLPDIYKKCTQSCLQHLRSMDAPIDMDIT